MRVLGVDPGMKATGYGCLEFDGRTIRVLETGTVCPKAKDLIQNRLNKIHRHLGDIISEHRPDVLVLEKLYAHHKHPATASLLGHVRGVICLLSAQKNVQLEEHSVKRIRKAVVGNGNATKIQTRRYVSDRLKIDEKVLTLDASDALALALGYIYMNHSAAHQS